MARARQILIIALAIYAICLNLTFATARDRSHSGLRARFYKHSCPQAESIVYDAVRSALHDNPGLAGAFLRMMFHDCFIRGCDASVLLDTTDSNNPAEKDGGPNRGSLRGFEVLDAAKAKIEAECPRTVSCADILVFATRDSVALNGGPWYSVAGGRRDGTVSLASETASLPGPNLNAEQLTQSFANRGMSQDDMVTLSGAHTIGQARCSVVQAFRLSPLDLTLDPAFAKDLQAQCPASNGGSRIFMDSDSPKAFDNGYYKSLVANRGLFRSDQTLYDDSATRHTVVRYSQNPHLFASKFVEAMGKLGALDVKTGNAGEIRLDCHRIN